MNTSPVEPFLRRDYKQKKFDWDILRFMAVGAVLGLLLATFLFFFVIHAHAATMQRTYSGVIENGDVLTPAEFCRSLI